MRAKRHRAELDEEGLGRTRRTLLKKEIFPLCGICFCEPLTLANVAEFSLVIRVEPDPADLARLTRDADSLAKPRFLADRRHTPPSQCAKAICFDRKPKRVRDSVVTEHATLQLTSNLSA